MILDLFIEILWSLPRSVKWGLAALALFLLALLALLIAFYLGVEWVVRLRYGL